MAYDHLLKAHRARAAADVLERETFWSSGDREADLLVANARSLAAAFLRHAADELEGGMSLDALADEIEHGIA